MTSFFSTWIFLKTVFFIWLDKCIWNLKKMKKSADSAKKAFFGHFKCIYLVNGMSDIIKPIHFLKVPNENFQIKKTVFKHIHMEVICPHPPSVNFAASPSLDSTIPTHSWIFQVPHKNCLSVYMSLCLSVSLSLYLYACRQKWCPKIK